MEGKEMSGQVAPTPPNEIIVQYRLWPFWAIPEHIDKVTRMMTLCMKGHNGQVRKYTGMPYWTHPFRLAMAISSYPQARLPWVCASLGHDFKEDTDVTDEQIIEASDKDTLALIDELTNTSKASGLPRRERKKLDWARLKTISFAGKVIKMHDRIDNLKEMLNAPVSFKKLYCEESEQLLEAIGDADKDIAWQVRSAIKYIYDWRFFPIYELMGKPKDTVLEHGKHGECWIGESGPDGHMQFASGMVAKFKFEGDDTLLNPLTTLMRETGTSK